MIPMPSRRAASGLPQPSSTPSKRTWPRSGLTTPAITFASVLLPAPFSPTRACTSPGNTVRLTSSKAWVPSKCLLIFRTRSSSLIAPALESQFVVHLFCIFWRDDFRRQRVLLLRLEARLAQNPTANLHGFVHGQRIVEGGCQHAVHHLLDSARGPAQPIHADKEHRSLTPQFARRQIGADGHRVVMPVHRVDLALSAKYLQHAFPAF